VNGTKALLNSYLDVTLDVEGMVGMKEMEGACKLMNEIGALKSSGNEGMLVSMRSKSIAKACIVEGRMR
jgi:hypothetical protein